MEKKEIVSLRGRYTKQYDLGGQKRQAVLFPYPVHYPEQGQWKEIDNELQPGERGGKAG